MATLTVTERGQVTLRKEYLQHLGVRPGEKIELTLLPNGRGELRAMEKKGRLEDLFGCLAGKTDVRLTIEEMNEAIAEAAAAEVMESLNR
jgi:bifunctional DNA-binding transcriptional regulator/antitoxin component of YhaV-PrlF toxin-antitoxin module